VTGTKFTLILAVDSFSKYVEAKALQEQYNAYDVAQFIFANIYCRWGAPVKIVIDREHMLSSGIVANLNKFFDCKVSVTNGTPQPNGQVEAYMKIFKEKMNARMFEHSNLYKLATRHYFLVMIYLY